MKQLKQKLVTENAILVQADKGKTFVVTKTDTYIENVQIFLAVKHFPTLPKYLTDKYQKLIQKKKHMDNAKQS